MKAYTVKIQLLTAALLAVGFLTKAQDKKISQLPALPSVSGGEAIPLAISGTNYYLTPTQLKTWLNIVGYVPLTGTLNSAPLTGTVEYRGGSNTTALVDTLGASFYIGSGNLKDLNSATKKSYIRFSGNTTHPDLSMSSSSSISTTSFDLKHNLFSLSISNNSDLSSYGFTSAVAGFGIFATDATGAYITKLNTTPSTIFLQSNNPIFAGATYNADYSANFTARSLIDKGYADATYAPLISGGYIPLAGTTSGNPITNVLELGNNQNAIWQNTTSGSAFYIGKTNNSTFGSSTHGSFIQFGDGVFTAIGYASNGAKGVITLQPNSAEISAYDASGYTTRFFQISNQSYVQSSNSGYVGFVYEATTAGYVAANGTGYSIFHRDYNDARYAPISAVLSGTGYVKQSGSSTSYITAVPNTDLANSTISGVALGGNLFNHTAGYGLSGSNYNGSSSQTWAVDTTSVSSKLYVNAKTNNAVYTTAAQTVSNKTLDNSNNITVKDNAFTIQNSSTTSKQVVVSAASVSTSTTRTLTAQDRNLTVAGTDDILPPRLSTYASSLGWVTGMSTSAGWQGFLRCCILPSYKRGLLTGIKFNVTTAVSGKNIKISIYSDLKDGTWTPNVPLDGSGSGNISCTTTGWKTYDLSGLTGGGITLSDPYYWIVFQVEDSGIGFTYPTSGSAPIPYSVNSSVTAFGRQLGQAYGTFPNPFGGGSSWTNQGTIYFEPIITYN